MADEEERLMRAMASRADKAFEERRKAALQGYQGKAAGGFKLAEDDNKKSTEAVKKTLANPALEGSGQKAVSPRGNVEQSPRNVEQSPRNVEVVPSGGGASRGYAASGTTDASQESLSNYFNKSAQGEADFQRKREEQDREKEEYLRSLSANGLAAYERQQADRDREFWRRQEENEKAKQDAIAGYSAGYEAYKQKQEDEEREFQRRRQEEDARKQEQLDAMKRQDEQRRQELLQRQAEEQAARKQRQEQEAASRNSISCEACRKTMTKQEAVLVKGKNYCYNCSVTANATKCSACSKPIIGGSTMKAGNKTYHPECLKCGKCGAVLSGGFRMRGTTMLCVNCSSQGGL